jgi:micrococcal nuclease
MRIAAGLGLLSFVCMVLGYQAKGVTDVVKLDHAERFKVVDGDTLVGFGIMGDRTRYRLNGIDAPEMPGHCRRGRNCVVGDPDLSRASLDVALDKGQVEIERIKQDRYGRWIAQVRAGGIDLSCWQIEQRQALYMPRWDEGGRTRRACNPSGL